MSIPLPPLLFLSDVDGGASEQYKGLAGSHEKKEKREMEILSSWLSDILTTTTHKILPFRGFPGGAVVKNPLAEAGDMGSIPGPGRPHMPRST